MKNNTTKSHEENTKFVSMYTNVTDLEAVTHLG